MTIGERIKAKRKEKNIWKKIGGSKECRNFAGEKKGTFFLVSLFYFSNY